MDILLRDVRFTLRQWRKAPGFTAVAVLAIGLGVGGTTTMLSVADSVVPRSLPGIRAPEELVEIRTANRAGRGGRPMRHSTFQTLQTSNTGLAALAAGAYGEVSVMAEGWREATLESCVTASANLFSVLGTRPGLGRLFSAGDGMSPVVVLSHRMWVQDFSEDPSVLGSTLTLNRHPFTVIGVAERGFHGHLPMHDFGLFVPISSLDLLEGGSPAAKPVLTIGRLNPGSSISRVRAATESLAEELRTADPAQWASSIFLVEPHNQSFQEVRGPITLLLGFLLALAVCNLLIACANLAGVLTSRALGRAQELAVRRALGSGRRRLVAQLLTESLLLSLVGGGAGVLMAMSCTWALGRIEVPGTIPLLGEYGPDLGILVLSLGLTLLTGVLFGLAPALRGTRGDLASTLKDPGSQAPSRQWMRKAFVVIQIAGAVVLLGGSGILFRALHHAASMELGFQARGTHVATVNLAIQPYDDDEGRVFFAQLLERAKRLPAVESAALADFVFLVSPPQRSAHFTTLEGEGKVEAGLFGVSPGFFRTMGVEVLEGRPFDASDLRGGEPVAMVNERVAGILWPGESPVGKILQSRGEFIRVVGLVKNGKYISVGESPLAGVFRPQTQHYVPTTSLLLKTREGGGRVQEEVKALIRGLDPGIPLSANAPLSHLIDKHFLPRRLAAVFAGVLGGMGIFLAILGVFGVLATLVTQRSSELALRMVLGATPQAVRAPVLRTGLLLILSGLALGVPLAVSLTSLVRIFLYGMDPADPRLFGALSLLFLLVGLAASYLPARRATRSDLSRLLREV